MCVSERAPEDAHLPPSPACKCLASSMLTVALRGETEGWVGHGCIDGSLPISVLLWLSQLTD